MTAIRVHQFHSGSAVGDAVTNGMFLIRDVLRARGIESDIFVEGRDPRLADELQLLGQLVVNPDDVLLIHHSMGHDVIPYIDSLQCKKLLVYHNITPPKYFAGSDHWQKYSIDGYAQINALRDMVCAAIADSDYNADELRKRGFSNVATIPLLRDFKAIRNRAFNQHHQHYSSPAYHLLFVGRIAGNKGQAELVEFMAAYADSFDYPLQLTLVGHSDHDGAGYGGRVRDLIATYGLEDRVHLAGHVSDYDLYGLYRAADAYVSLSQHEGFGVPLVEAMAFDLPIVAYDTAAISSTLGDSGVRISDTRPDTIARALAPVLMSKEKRREVIGGQRRRLEDFDVDKRADELFEFLARYVPGDPRFGTAAAAESQNLEPRTGRRYVIQGPCETTYSLAIVNRSLATGLDRMLPGSTCVVPMEGHGDYPFDADQAAAYPEVGRLLSIPPTAASDLVVTIRNTYPPRPAGMMGDLRLMNFFWEETEVPRETVALMERHLDGILVASSFGKAALRNSGLSIPAEVIGCGIDHQAVPKSLPDVQPRGDKPFRFLHVSSGLARKGIEELLKAYLAAFTAADAVELVIKTYDNDTNVVRPLYEEMIGHRPNAPIVRVIAGSMSSGDIGLLYRSSDAVVLATRGEGFNLPAAEAMISATPVLVTGFSAHMDFCNDDTAWLIDFDFEPSQSHVRSSHANWVRARSIDLALIMRRLVTQDPVTLAERDRKRANAFLTASSLTWAQSARKTDQFVDMLMTTAPSKSRLKLAWVSTWNTKCGIASYSEFLVPNLTPNAIGATIFANRESPNSPDDARVVRNWDLTSESIQELVASIIEADFDAVVIQYNFGFFSIKALGEALRILAAKDIDTYVFFHKTEGSVVNGRSTSLADIADELRVATRLIVHAVDDVNRLKGYGLIDNVAQIPHGLPGTPAFDPAMVKRFLGMRETYPLIASYGFLLPHKGISELIMAFGLLRADHPNAKLLLLNGQYPAPQSAEEARLCRNLISELGLESEVILITDYMQNEDVALMLHAADAIVYPYQDTEESASGAVRFGLAALRPVAVTPLAIFRDVADYCYTLPGTSAPEIAEGLRALIADENTRDALVARQKTWLEDVNWSQIGKRLTGMMLGLHNDNRDVKIRPERLEPKPALELAPTTDATDVLYQLSEVPFVRLACQRILGRDPNPAEQAAAGEIRAGRLSRAAFLVRLRGEAEAVRADRDRARTEVVSFDDLDPLDDEVFVKALYTRLLYREGDESGVANHTRRLAEGSATRGELIADFLQSDEFLNNDRIVSVAGGGAAPFRDEPMPEPEQAAAT